MSDISIQVRRVTERVRQYYKVFGFRSHAVMTSGRSVIRGGRRTGFDEIECVVAETARGTSVGFYALYSFQSLIFSIPFIFAILIQILNSIEGTSPYISGGNGFKLDFHALFLGGASANFKFYFIMTLLAIFPVILDIAHQRIRLANLKSRFTFFTRDAIWDTREAPNSLFALQGTKTILNHVWIIAILYFGTFAIPSETQMELFNLYNTSNDDLRLATADAFSTTLGLVLGLLSANKALNLRKNHAKIDSRNRITGGSLERRIDPILYGMQAASYTAIISGLFLSVTFFRSTPSSVVFQMLGFALIGGIIAGTIYNEGEIWVTSTYGLIIFFTSLVFIFRTGVQPAYAFIIILQLFILPIPFLLLISLSIRDILKQKGIDTMDWMYDTLPILPLVNIYTTNKKKSQAKKRYIESLDREILSEVLDTRILIQKDFLLDRTSVAHKTAVHYYELLLSYTASFDDESFIYIPTSQQLLKWWEDRTKEKSVDLQLQFLDFIDQLLWDPRYLPDQNKITDQEKIGQTMVLQIQ